MECYVFLKCENIVLDDGDKEDKPIWYYPKFDEYGIPHFNKNMRLKLISLVFFVCIYLFAQNAYSFVCSDDKAEIHIC